MIAAIYARKSTEQNGVADDAKSLRRQVDHATAYAQKKGWTVAEEHIYVDDGISGAEFAKRPGLMRMLNAVKVKPKPPFDVLVMSEESRLGREAIETSYILKQLVTSGVQAWFYLENRQRTLGSAMEKAMLALQTMSDEMERERSRQRTRDALERKARAGQVTGGRVFGYDNVDVVGPNGARSHVDRKLNPVEAPVVRRIFELAAKGIGQRSIAKQLNDERAPSPRAQQGRPRGWAPSSIRTVLHRPLYRGQIVWASTTKRDEWGRVRQLARPESEWLRVDAPHLRIVSDKLWDAAHIQLREVSEKYLRGTDGKLWGRPASGVESKYLLPGIARCAICKGGMLVRTGTHGKGRAHFYACSSYHLRGTAICGNGLSEVMRQVDKAVLQEFKRQLTGDGILDEVLDAAVAHMAPARTNLSTDKASLTKTLQRLDAEVERITMAIAAGGEMKALVEALKAREAERAQLQRRLNQGEVADRRMAVTPTRLREQLAERFSDWTGLLHRHPAQARQILKKLLDGPLRFTPRKGYYEFEGDLSFAKMLGDVAFPISVASPPGFEPGFQP